MRAYIGETMLISGRVHMPERGIGTLSEALGAACADAVRVSTGQLAGSINNLFLAGD